MMMAYDVPDQGVTSPTEKGVAHQETAACLLFSAALQLGDSSNQLGSASASLRRSKRILGCPGVPFSAQLLERRPYWP